MQYDNILKNSEKKMVIGMYIHIQSDIYPPDYCQAYLHYNNSTSLLDITMHFKILYYQKS